MRNVTRRPLPNQLRKYSRRWTKALLEEIEKSKRTGDKVPDRYYNKYKHDDVKEELRRMYGDGDFCYCCYCESIIDDVSYEHIEHRMPKKRTKDKYPEQTYEWENLHLSCEKCNSFKGTKYDEKYPILDATKDSIKEHLGYVVSDTDKGVYRETLTRRGTTTVKHTHLDRSSLRRARLKVYHVTVRAIQEIMQLGDDPRVYTKVKMLRDMSKEEHGSLIEHLLEEWNVSTE